MLAQIGVDHDGSHRSPDSRSALVATSTSGIARSKVADRPRAVNLPMDAV
jgi:hypothetical protein